MEALTIPIVDGQGNRTGEISLEAKIFGSAANAIAIYQATNSFLANQRKGLASTKTRGEVSGGGRKPWRQKGTGRARVGSIRSPLWRHGGVVFGPHPRDFSFSVPKKIRILALKSAIIAKAQEKNLLLVEDIPVNTPSAKEAAKWLSNLPLQDKKKNKRIKTLLLLDKIDKQKLQAFRNLEDLSLNTSGRTHAWEVLAHKKVVFSKAAFEDLIKRFKK